MFFSHLVLANPKYLDLNNFVNVSHSVFHLILAMTQILQVTSEFSHSLAMSRQATCEFTSNDSDPASHLVMAMTQIPASR